MAIASHQHRTQHNFSSNITTPDAHAHYHQTEQFRNQRPQQPAFVFSNLPNQVSSLDSWSHQQSVAVPRSAQTPEFSFSSPVDLDVPLPVDQVPELMNSDHWQTSPSHQYSSTHRGHSHLPSHQRNSSLSTLGSATAPSSPYAQTSSNPHIAITDSNADGLSDYVSQDTFMATMCTPIKQEHSFYSQYPSSLSHMSRPGTMDTTYARSTRPSGQDLPRSFLPPSELNRLASSNPVSVASSVASDSPATPLLDEQHSVSRKKRPAFHPTVPKLDRTMTDVYGDELFNPQYPITTTAAVAPSTPTSAVSPNSDIFSQRLNAANSQRLSAAHSPATTISRDKSPFRHGSPLAPVSHDFNTARMPAASHQSLRFQPAQEKPGHGTHHLMHQHQHPQQAKTVSPRDVTLEFPETAADADFPLFATDSHHFMGLDDGTVAHTTQSYSTIPVTSSHDVSSFSSFIPTSIPHQYPFMPKQQEDLSQHQQVQQSATSVSQVQSPPKPASSSTDRGTFSCTYVGCPLRFETAALLQKHKREGHRQAHGLGGGRRADAGLVGLANSQAGPHKCTQINPSTGKPCNTEFSRPYDLTRHEDTIHNPKKKKVTCPACTDKKQFSRGDALSRHYRVCHPDLPVPGKRRGGAGRG